MKYQQIKWTLVAMSLSTLLYLSSCNKKDKDKDNDTELAGDNAMSEGIYNDVLKMADDASEKNSGENLENFKTASNCATVTRDTLSSPKTITIDFGPTNCLCNDNRYRRGKVLISYTGQYKDSGSVHQIGFDAYYVNDHHVMGTKTRTNMGHNILGQSYYNIQVNGLIVKASGDSLTWNSTRTRTWTQGEPSSTKLDDVYEIMGSATGTKGTKTYTMTITQALVRKLDCQWIVQGIMQVTPFGKPTRTIDFGNGTCDNLANVTIAGTTYTITLN